MEHYLIILIIPNRCKLSCSVEPTLESKNKARNFFAYIICVLNSDAFVCSHQQCKWCVVISVSGIEYHMHNFILPSKQPSEHVRDKYRPRY